MVDFDKQAPNSEPDYEDPLTSLNLRLSVPFDCWPELSESWTALASEVRSFLQNVEDIEAVSESPLPQLLSSSVGNMVLMRTSYLAKQTAETEQDTMVNSRLENLYRNRGESKIAELEEFIENVVVNTQFALDTSALKEIVSRVRHLHEGICRAIDNST